MRNNIMKALIYDKQARIFFVENKELFLGPERNAMIGASAAMGITYLFERKSFKLFLINAGYHVVTFTIMGLILGVWK